MTDEFQYLPAGLPSELNFLDLDEVCQHYVTHMRNFMLDENMGAGYFNRFASDTGLADNINATKCFVHLVKKMHQLAPLNGPIQGIYGQLFKSPEAAGKAKLLTRYTADPKTIAAIDHLTKRSKHAHAHDILLKELQEDTSNIVLADMLMDLDLQADIEIDSWLDEVNVQDLFATDWKARLAFIHAKNGKYEQALKFWDTLTDTERASSEVLCNFMAASFLKTGDTGEAHKLFTRSLELDPAQLPIKLAKNELDDPFIVREDALENIHVAICIYSYNKEELLEMTLKSVCESSIGKSDVLVLLNGCTDDSRSVLKRIQANYPEISIEPIIIPINMGAPAARNYLINHVMTTRKSDYIAFLDDDVTLPAKWLQSLVTAIEEDDKIGAVGCKVLNPDNETLQYMFRDVSLAKPGAFRLSLGAPFWNRDIGLYDVRKDVDNIMGCCHLMRRECFDKVPTFDICFSPSQLDDVAFHLDLRLAGYTVRYLGQLSCVHHRSTGFQGLHKRTYGNSLGNDVKFYYRFLEHFDQFLSWQRERNAAGILSS